MRRTTTMAVGALLVLSCSGCLTKTVLERVSGEPAGQNPMTQPGSLAKVVEANGSVWAYVRYPGEVAPRTLRIRREAGASRAQFCQVGRPPVGRALPIVAAAGNRGGVWLDGNELWERDARGERILARVPSTDDPLQRRREGPEPVAKRIVWAGLLPFAFVVDVTLGVPALLLGLGS